MDISFAQFLVDNANDHAEIYENYSGRGMFGSTTTGVVCDNPINLLLVAVEYMKNENPEDVEDIEVPCQLRTDNMALQTIIY